MAKRSTGKIRVGLIRCDTHGMWFGPQMMDHDPKLLERATTEDQDDKIRYTWMRRGVHYFFYTYYWRPGLMTAPRVDGFEITRLWDADHEAAELASKVFHGRPKVCDSFEEASDDVDLVFIADCNGDGSDHYRLAAPGLRKGVPTFIDKPFAHRLADVRRILELGREHRAPVMSLSILQTNPPATRFAKRMDEIGGASFGTVTGFSTHPAALVHALSIAHAVFGTGVHTVHCLKTPQHTTLHLDYAGHPGRPEHGVTLQCGVARFRFTNMFASAYGPGGAIHSQVLDDFDASQGSAVILEYVKEMVHTRQPHPLSNEMAEAIAVMDACRKAEASGKPAKVAKV